MSKNVSNKDGCIQDITEYEGGFSVIASILKWENGSREWVGEYPYLIEFETWNALSELERNEEYTLHHELVEQYILDCFMEYHMENNERIEDFEIEWYEIDLNT